MCSILNPRESQRRLTLDTTTLTSDFGYETNISFVCINPSKPPCDARCDHSIRIPAMKYTIYPLSFLRKNCLTCLYPLRGVFILLCLSMTKLLFEIFPLGLRDDGSVGTHQCDVKVNFLLRLPSRFQISAVSP